MTYKQKYSDIMEQCVMLSQFEGRDYYSEDGESLYHVVKITEQDRPLVLGYIQEGAHRLEDMLERMISGSSYTEDGFEWELRTEETRWNADKHLAENMTDALKCYAMSCWLDGRKSNRTEWYTNMYAEMSSLCQKSVMRKLPPKKRVKETRYTDTIEIETR